MDSSPTNIEDEKGRCRQFFNRDMAIPQSGPKAKDPRRAGRSEKSNFRKSGTKGKENSKS